MGSPPPMRGKVTNHAPRLCRKGITPAYAGKSIPHGAVFVFFGDHPRLCGEKVKRKPVLLRQQGSPPPMRGKDGFEYFNVKQIRITPAYAGKSDFVAVHKIIVEDHPRLCGEKKKPHRTVQKGSGSPPPMRGKVVKRKF